MIEESDEKEEDSIYSLGCQLCQQFASSHFKSENYSSFEHFVGNSEKQRQQRTLLKRCKQKFFSVILNKFSHDKVDKYDMPIQDFLAACEFDMELQNEEEKAKKLKELVASLTLNKSVSSILKLMVDLKDSNPYEDTKKYTYMGNSISSYDVVDRRFREFPSHLFHVNNSETQTVTNANSYKQFTPEMFDLSLEYPSLSLETRLGLDDDKTNVRKGSASLITSESVLDEGYMSPGPCSDIWDNILSVRGCERLTWESAGQRISLPDKPFLSESGPSSVHYVWNLAMSNLSHIDPDIGRFNLISTSVEKLILDIGYLLAGISSSIFYSDESCNFYMKRGVTLDRLSPECLAAFCQDFLVVGSLAKKLELFCSCLKYSGKILSGFVFGVKKFLRVYTNSVLSLSRKFDKNLGQLSRVMASLMKQLTFLAGVCNVHQDNGAFPDGVSLLSKILEASVHVSNNSINLLLTSLLSSAAAPYLRFLKHWMFSGDSEGFTHEFGLEIDPFHINSRDEMYWNSAYKLVVIEGSSFLSDIQEKVHLTGKSLSLLRLISPDHFMSGQHRDAQPTLQLAVTAGEQVTLQESCKAYESHMLQIARECSESYSQKRAKEEEAKVRTIEDILKKNEENKLRREEHEAKMREEKIKKQKKLYADLQEQAKAVKERKIKEKEAKEREIKKIEEEAEKMEAEIRHREEEEKRKMEEFYARLNADAEMRERRAEWRMKRSDPFLKSKRLALHQEEELALLSTLPRREIMDNNTTADQDLVDNMRFEKDDLGNITVMMEDDEGNLISEKIDDTLTLDQTVKENLSTESMDNVPVDTKRVIAEQIHKKSPFININTRNQNKNLVLGSNIDFTSDPGPTMSSKNIVNHDQADGRFRKSSSGQQIERLLYPQRYYSVEEEVFTPSRTDLQLNFFDKPIPYRRSFKFSNVDSLQEMGGPCPIQEPAKDEALPPLTLILQNSILAPLRVQSRLVNSALLNHMLVDRQLAEHFKALKNYLLLADGEFGRQLVLSLCQLGHQLDHPSQLAGQLYSHFQSGAPVPMMLSPSTLNRVLDTALSGSILASADPFSKNLTFLLEQVGERNIGIPGLSLTYQANWPDNIVLSLDTVSKYSLILDFQLELRLTMLSLELDWENENLVVRKDKKNTMSLLHKVNLMRHEMMHFMRNLHDYVASQVLEISWMEFQENLNKVSCLDDLIMMHEKYLNRALFRCLLNPKAAPVMKVVRDIFASVTKFSGMISSRMTGDEKKNWSKIETQYKVFSQYSRYFVKLVNKLATRGYQPHLQDLLLRLNMNGFYN